MKYFEGQRWYSETEPELGLGIILKSEDKRVQIEFPLTQEKRVYGIASAPLKRFRLEIGDKFKTVDGQELTLEERYEQNNVYFYKVSEEIYPELILDPQIDLNGPLERVTIKNFDDPSFFELRYQSYLNKRHYEGFQFKGFLGPKVRLIPHQIYVASEVLKMEPPKAMLCDEVGLGKTIEACLIINSLINKEIIQSALFIVPDSLVNQWFIELYTKFNLSAHYIHESESNVDFDETRFLIVSSKVLKSSEKLREQIRAKNWESLVIDESHQFNLQQENSENNLLREISDTAYCSLLLSATPEILGHTNLFYQLQFLDRVKYNDINDFEKKLSDSKELSKLITIENILEKREELSKYFSNSELSLFKSNQECKQALIDRFGTGRNYFRNSRTNLERFSRLFNDRVLNPYIIKKEKIKSETDVLREKFLFISDLLESKGNEKILVICHSKKAVQYLHRKLQEISNEKMAMFHSEQSLLERDRQAAFFADDDGAKILLTTEIGSEGRNFEFAGHLVLFDLPLLPDQLEQRIGRLDRIGQKNDIQIHIPYAQNTFEDILFRWYQTVLNAFESSPKGANSFYEKNHTELKALLGNEFSEKEVSNKIEKWRTDYTLYKKEIEEGRDIIVEAHSYHDANAKNIISSIEHFQEQTGPITYLELAFDKIGIRLEDLGREIFFIAPTDNMLIPSFPGLNSEGFSGSFDREIAIKYPQIQYLSWEHPIIKNTLDLFLNNSLGNATLVRQEEVQQIYFEFIIALSCTNQDKHKAQKYLPFTPIRVLIDSEMKDVTKKLPKKFIDEISLPVPDFERDILEQIPKEIYKKALEKAQELARKKSAVYKQKAHDEFKNEFTHEEQRLAGLHIDHNEREKLKNRLDQDSIKINNSIDNSSLVFDAIRLIIPKI